MSILLFFQQPAAVAGVGVDFSNLQIEYFYDSAWVSLIDDVVADPIRWSYGIDGNGPSDCVAAPGKLTFALDNSTGNTAGLLGYYSPRHANAREGWGFGASVRLVCTYGAGPVVRFLGKIRDINPVPGEYRERVVRVSVYDGMYDLLEAKARAVTLQSEKTEAELIEAVLDSLPATAQPAARDFDPGLDTLPLAFDDLGKGTKALSLIVDVARSSGGLYAQIGDGTHIFRNRHSRGTGVSLLTLDGDFVEMEAPSSSERCFNVFEVTIHPKVVSAAATDALYELPTAATIEVAAGQSVDVWLDYTDPNDRQTKVGGVEVVTSLVGGTHYSANQSADGSGANLTGNITATLTPFASRAKFSLTNTGAQHAYIRTLTVVGKAVRDLGPQTYEASSEQDYGEHPMAVDMPYQDDPQVAISAASFWELQYRSLENQIDRVRFNANHVDLMESAITLDIGDLITVSEEVTGIEDVRCVINKIECEYTPSRAFWVTYGLGPSAPFEAWLPGVEGRSEPDETTVPGW
jgi:hypothetical protein